MARTAGLSRFTLPVIALALASLGLGACSSASATGGSAPTVYVANHSTLVDPASTLAVINASSGAILQPLATGALPSAMALTPDGKDLLVTNQGDNQLTEFSVASGRELHRVGVGLEPDAVAVDPKGTLAIVANYADNTVTLVDLSDFAAGPAMAVGQGPVAVAFAPDGRSAAVANFRGGTVSLLTTTSPASVTVTAKFVAGAEPTALCYTNKGTELFVADLMSSQILPVSLSGPTPLPLAPIGLGADPTALASIPDTDTLVASAGARLVTISTTARRVLKQWPLAFTVRGVAITPGTTRAWVAGGNGTATEVDLSDGRVLHSATVGGQPSAVIVAPA